MRLIKMFGLAALASVVAMAFIGASSASALNTQLCKEHTSLTCPAGKGTTEVHQVNVGVGKLLSDLVDVLCLNVLANATPLALASPQIVHATALSFTNCGTTSAHNNCVVTVEELPLSNLNKTGLDAGILTATNGRTRVVCEDVTIFKIDIDCKYDTTGIEFAVAANHLTANETPVEKVGGSFLCPNESTLDGLLQTLVNTYVLQ